MSDDADTIMALCEMSMRAVGSTFGDDVEHAMRKRVRGAAELTLFEGLPW